MKRFVIEVLFFGLLLVGTLWLLKQSVPFYWGNQVVAEKIEHVLEEDRSFDAFFVGSSKTYRHINPIIFDELSGQRTFNLGAPGTFALEVDYLLDHFIPIYDKGNPITYYLKELELNRLWDGNIHTIEGKYFMDFKRYRKSLSHFLIEKRDLGQAYYHTLSFLSNQLCIGEVFPIVNYHFTKKNNLNPLVFEQKGFYALDQEVALEGTPKLINRRKQLLEIIEEGGTLKRGIKQMDVLPIPQNYFTFSKIPSNISFYQIKGSPFEDNKYYFDRGHYNKEGAEVYTRAILSAID